MFKGFRTRIASLLTVAFGAASTLIPTVQHTIPKDWYGPILIGVGVIFAILRELTTTPPGQSKPSDTTK